LLVRSTELKESGQRDEEMAALKEAMALDPSFGDDPSVARFAERAKVLRFEVEREAAMKKAVADEIAHDPRLGRRWGLGFLLLSTKGILVVEGHWTPKSWLDVALGVDLIGPGVDVSAKIVPLVSNWSPIVGVGAHYGFNAWQRTPAHGSTTVNGMRTDFQLSYDDIWGKMFHADLGMQWRANGGFAAEFSAGPMLYYTQATSSWNWFGFVTLGLGWYFR
jgi:hypothetical protein